MEMQVAAGGQPTDLRKVLQQITSEGFLPKTEFVIPKQNFTGVVREGATKGFSFGKVECSLSVIRALIV